MIRFAQKILLEAQTLIKELEVREARIVELEATLGLNAPGQRSSESDRV